MLIHVFGLWEETRGEHANSTQKSQQAKSMTIYSSYEVGALTTLPLCHSFFFIKTRSKVFQKDAECFRRIQQESVLGGLCALPVQSCARNGFY